MKQVIGLGVTAIIVSGCVTPLEPVRSEPDRYENDSSMEKYVDCLRDKKREETDAPCQLE